jgi:hypothetical protein
MIEIIMAAQIWPWLLQVVREFFVMEPHFEAAT